MTDIRINRIASASVLAALLAVLFLPLSESGRIVAAVLLLPAAALIPFYVKKRAILSIHKNQILLIMTVLSLVVVMLYYLSGLKFGFYRNPYGLSASNFFKFFLPITAIIVCTEIIRYVFMTQKDKFTGALCYLSCVVADMLICSNIPSVTSFNRFMDLVAGALFPALLSNLLFNYLSKRYGVYPNLIFRLITTLYAYTLPIVSAIEDSLVNFFRILLPIAVFLFIDTLYEKKRRFALGKKSRLWKISSGIITAFVLIIMVGTVMLVSNQFHYGSLVIATESMTGELNKGDMVIYESYEDQPVEVGQVIIFEKNNTMIVHRVVDIEIINGYTRYYTKGDANEDNDAGFITDAEIVGLAGHKLPYLGYPSLWIRSLFQR